MRDVRQHDDRRQQAPNKPFTDGSRGSCNEDPHYALFVRLLVFPVWKLRKGEFSKLEQVEVSETSIRTVEARQVVARSVTATS
jgi:hypothetical protein